MLPLIYPNVQWSTMKTKLANYISIIGNPILTISLFAVISFFTYEAIQKAFLHSFLMVAGIAVPLTVKMYRGSKNGTYSNFDISDQKERQSWYFFPIIILFIVTILLYLMHSSRTLLLSILFALILLIISQVVNYFVKCSLHVSFNVYLSFLILRQHLLLGLVFIIFTVLIAWSRLVLKRHSLTEIMAGLLCGLAIGMLVLISFWKTIVSVKIFI